MKTSEYQKVATNGKYTLLCFPKHQYKYVWVLQPELFFGRLIWEQGFYFKSKAQALDFMSPDESEAA